VAALRLSESKKKARAQGAALIHADEATFRQDATLHRTWARRGCQPEFCVTGQRKTVKVFGSVDVFSARFIYRLDTVFNAKTYLKYLDQVAHRYFPQPVIWIEDNASYHKTAQVREWYAENSDWWTTANLPPYSPEYNAQERIWHHTRMEGTHNRYFEYHDELRRTLSYVFRSMQLQPDSIRGYLRPFS
jgi:transposase